MAYVRLYDYVDLNGWDYMPLEEDLEIESVPEVSETTPVVCCDDDLIAQNAVSCNLETVLPFCCSIFYYYVGSCIGQTTAWEDYMAEFRAAQNLPHEASLRDDFRTARLPSSDPNPMHPHGKSAAARSDGDNFINRFILGTGYEVFSVSSSRKDFERNFKGTRRVYFVKDAIIPRTSGDVTARSIFKMVDVDYYLKEEQILCDHPVLMYTMVPESLAYQDKDSSFYFTEDGKTVITQVIGGGQYIHEIWNYDSDVFSTFRFDENIWNFVYTVYSCEKKRVAPHRCVVLIIPASRCYGLRALFCYLSLGVKSLQRVDTSFGKLQLLSTYTDGCNNLSVKFPEDLSEITLRREDWSAFRKLTGLHKNNLDVGNIQRKLSAIGKYQEGNQTLEAPLLIKEICCTWEGEDVKTIYTVPDILNYQPVYKDLCFDKGLPSGRLIGEGMFRGGVVAPCSSLSSDIRCIEARIEKPRKDPMVFPEWCYTYAMEFNALLIPQVGKMVAYSFEEVAERMKRPTQKQQLTRVEGCTELPEALVIASFDKKEAYDKCNDPRNISNMSPEHKKEYASYVYAMAENTKGQHWYGFGKTPQELEELVHTKASNARKIVNTDFSRLDGSLVDFLRATERARYLRAFPKHEHENIKRCIDAMIGARGITKHGVGYLVGTSRPSGAQDTSDGNSTLTAMYFYMVFRKMGLSPEVAYSRLGIYAGDDGFTPDADPDVASKVALVLGLDVKLELFSEGAVTFLGRIYWNPWVNGHSTIDIERCIRKLHYTASPETVPNEVVMVRKALSLAFTDPNTPILGVWANEVLRKYRASVKSVESDIVTDDFSNYYFMHGKDQPDAKGFTNPEIIPGDSALLDYFDRKFGITFEKIVEVENLIRQGIFWPMVYEYPEVEVKPGTLYKGEVFGEIPKAPIETKPNGRTKYAHVKDVSKVKRSVADQCDRINGKPCQGTRCKKTAYGKHKFCNDCHSRKTKKGGRRGYRSNKG